ARGVATAPAFTANTIAGSYNVTATAFGGSNPSTTFALSNAPQLPSVSVAFGPFGEVLVVVRPDGTLTQYDAFGAHALGAGVSYASVAFGPAGEVLLVTRADGTLTQYDASGAHVLGAGVGAASVA